MERGTFFGLQLASVDPLVLCAVAALVLVGLIVGGFALLWREERGAQRPAGVAHHEARELGLRRLWQLERAVRGPGRRLPTAGRVGQVDGAR